MSGEDVEGVAAPVGDALNVGAAGSASGVEGAGVTAGVVDVESAATGFDELGLPPIDIIVCTA
jgi:hypothetical protein